MRFLNVQYLALCTSNRSGVRAGGDLSEWKKVCQRMSHYSLLRVDEIFVFNFINFKTRNAGIHAYINATLLCILLSHIQVNNTGVSVCYLKEIFLNQYYFSLYNDTSFLSMTWGSCKINLLVVVFAGLIGM